MESDAWRLEDLLLVDLDEVAEIEKACFTTPWSKALFADEMAKPDICAWRVARPLAGAFRVAGYMGYWKAVDEAHITNLAVRPDWRRQGLGRALALDVLAHAKARGCLRATLEVRPSNKVAVALYQSLGFESVAFRPRYYIDNDEDALIMWNNAL